MTEVALSLVTDGGFEALTMQRLADEMGYAVGAFYRYFKSKDELLLAVQRRVLEELAADFAETEAKALAHLARSRAVTPEAAALTPVVALARSYVTLGRRRPAHAALLSRWLGQPEPLVGTEAAAPVLGGLIEMFGAVPRLLAAAADAGALSAGPMADPLRRAFVLWSALQGVLQMRKLARFDVDALKHDPLVDELMRALFLGWGADENAYADAARRANNIVPDNHGGTK